MLEKDALLLYHSYKRRGFALSRFIDYFNICQTALNEAEGRFPIRRVSQEHLSGHQGEVFRELCNELGLEFDEKYISRPWCKRNMYGINFIWLFKKPYDFALARNRALEEVTQDEMRILRDKLIGIEDDSMLDEM